MSETITINQNGQIGVESTAGTLVPANKLLEAVEIIPQAMVEQAKFRKQGRRHKTVIEPGKDYTGAKFSGLATYTEMIYLLSAMLGAPAFAGVGATSHSQTWAPALTGSITPKTLTIEQGDAVRARKFGYGFVHGFQMKYTRDEVTISGDIMGQQLKDDGTVTMTPTPTAIGIVPILGTQWSVFLDPTSGAIGTTQLLRVLEADFSYKGAFGPVWTGNSGITSFATIADLAPVIELKLLMEADTQGMSLLNTYARAGATAYVQLLSTGIVIPSDTPHYTFQHNFAGRVTAAPSAYADKEGVYAIEWTLEAFEDTVLGYANQFVLTNAIASL